MRLYYVDEREGEGCFVRSALGVDAERWNDLFQDVRAWRMELRDRYGIRPAIELQPFDLLAPPVGSDAGAWLSAADGAAVFRAGLQLIEDAARRRGDIEVINVCLPRQDRGRHEQTSLGRLLTRINTAVSAANRHAFLIFDEVREEPITRLYRRLRVNNPIPSRYESWDDGSPTRNIPLDRVIGGPAFRSAGGDHILQLAGFVAHALLLQEEGAGRVEDLDLAHTFAALDRALNREASARDAQGVVRR
ncbi:MAG: hypothetical protein OXE43_15415 [Chloroflexi bacterium]|nr:hypothetical protein [Chloroflexota bacterium]